MLAHAGKMLAHAGTCWHMLACASASSGQMMRLGMGNHAVISAAPRSTDESHGGMVAQSCHMVLLFLPAPPGMPPARLCMPPPPEPP
eukprot:351816-Chlamydomonas_euryale.AAC.2